MFSRERRLDDAGEQPGEAGALAMGNNSYEQ